MATLATLLLDIRAVCDRDGDTAVTDAQLTVWANQEYAIVRRRLADSVPDPFTKIKDFTLASGNTQDVTAAPMSLTDFGKLLSLSRLSGTSYQQLMLAPLGSVYDGTGLDASGSYRARYLTKAATLAGTDPVDLPDGADGIVRERVAARLRVRFDEDPKEHKAFAQELFAETVASLRVLYPATPYPGIIDVSEIGPGYAWRMRGNVIEIFPGGYA